MTLQPGDEIEVGNWGTLSPRPSPAALPAGAPLRWWRAALQLELTRAHAGFPAGTTFLIGWVAADRVPLAPAAVEPTPTTTTTPPRDHEHRRSRPRPAVAAPDGHGASAHPSATHRPRTPA